ncbi:hypothetical protein Tco_0276448 [Tanacetum coccineum]
MQPLRQSQRLSKSHQHKNSVVYISNSESPSTGVQSEQKKNKKRSSRSSSAKPVDQIKKSKLSYAPEFDFQVNKGSKSKTAKPVDQIKKSKLSYAPEFDFQANKGSKSKTDNYTLTVLSQVMSTPAYIDLETITQADGAQSSRVPVPLPNDPYVVVRRAHLVNTDTDSDLLEAPSKAEDSQPLGSRVPLIGEEFEAFKPSSTRTISSYSSASSDSTAPLSPGHPLTHSSPTPIPT